MKSVYEQLVEVAKAQPAHINIISAAVLELDYLQNQVDELNHTIVHAYRQADGTWLNLEELAQRYDNAIKAARALGEVYARD